MGFKEEKTARKIRLLQEALLEQLSPYQDKLFVIADSMGRVGFHPLAPQIRFTWYLKPFIIPEKKTSAPALVAAAQIIKFILQFSKRSKIVRYAYRIFRCDFIKKKHNDCREAFYFDGVLFC